MMGKFHQSKIDKYFLIVENRAGEPNMKEACVCYLSLGELTIKIENYIQAFSSQITTQFGFCLTDETDSYDKVFRIIFGEKPGQDKFSKEMIHESQQLVDNPSAKTHYLYCETFSIDVVRKMGHLFVKQINDMVCTSTQSLVHAAAVGIDGQGVLICARGGSGKSTLAVSAMLDGFQYVSDDYLILSKTDRLYAYPIYSVINLSPDIYPKMKSLQAEYMYDSYYNPKCTMNINAHRERVVKKLPINWVIFPQITDEKVPAIKPMNKGKAIVQLVHSTISQTNDYLNTGTVKKLVSLVSDKDFYQINLSPDLDANVQLLRQFIKENQSLCIK
jgi:hypothetical protein